MSALFQLPVKVAPRGLPPVTETMPPAIERLIREVNPEKIILFGSYAYGAPTPDSDVDLLVIVKPKEGETRRERYLRVALALTPRWFPADIIVKTPEEIKRALSDKRNFFIRDIVRRGKTLYARKNRSRHLDRTRGG